MPASANRRAPATDAPAKRAPTHRVYVVKGEGEKSIWTRIGAAWANRDGKGFSVQLDAAPIHGRVVIREITERDNGAQQ
ncbi:MAG: hypothetical protein QOD42_2846 [Sphingomonadales bacterium]|jgi:uncharacterized protein (DUF736 family)|nr:hypothetical protein [Sphingomonadales bacterium]